MSLTLLSLWLTSSWHQQLAAARTAVGAWLSATSVPAHSYTTAVEGDCSSARMILMYLPLDSGCATHDWGERVWGAGGE